MGRVRVGLPGRRGRVARGPPRSPFGRRDQEARGRAPLVLAARLPRCARAGLPHADPGRLTLPDHRQAGGSLPYLVSGAGQSRSLPSSCPGGRTTVIVPSALPISLSQAGSVPFGPPEPPSGLPGPPSGPPAVRSGPPAVRSG